MSEMDLQSALGALAEIETEAREGRHKGLPGSSGRFAIIEGIAHRRLNPEEAIAVAKFRGGPAIPVLQPMEAKCQEIGVVIGQVLDGHAEEYPGSPRIGFALLMFTFGEAVGTASVIDWLTHVSNADQRETIAALREMVGKLEGE